MNQREKCRASFKHFVNYFWDEIPGSEKLDWNWHLDVLCEELQKVAERVFLGLPKEHDVIFNVSPGTSKSSMCSILFPAWVWIRMPNAKFITASHAADLVLDLANKSRHVIRSEKYQKHFSDITISDEQDTKGYFANNQGGYRYSCTVAGKSSMGFHGHFHIVDDAINPKKMVSEAEIKTCKDFFDSELSGRMVDKAVTVLFLIMQRLHDDDPTGHLLEKSKRKGSSKIRHICIPAEISDEKIKVSVSPPELVKYYTTDGLMDPKRLSWLVLNQKKADGVYAYSGQYLQSPVPPGGGMFKEMFFTNRVKAAPYHAKRVLYVDKAFTIGKYSCNTAVTLLAEHEGNFYVGPVWVGKWEPDERDLVILCAAQQCRDRFGPRHEPTVVIEQEPAAGVDSYRQLAKKLRGFRVQADPARSNKILRADPWASQCAARNVYIVEDGNWDIAGWIDEHCHFPLGKYLDRVDSAAGGFNWLTKNTVRNIAEQFYILKGRSKDADKMRVVSCDSSQLAVTVLEEPFILVFVKEPEIVKTIKIGRYFGKNKIVSNHPVTDIVPLGKQLPQTQSDKLIDHVIVTFADLSPADLQQVWDQPLTPWNKLPADLIMSRQHAKSIWSCITRKRTRQPDTILVCGEGSIPQSLALGICDALHLERKKTVEMLGSEEVFGKDTLPLNLHIFQTIKDGRFLVV